MLQKREFNKDVFYWRLSTVVTAVSGLISLVVFLLIVFNYLQVRAADPVNDLLITELRQEYAALPDENPALAQRIRNLDLLNRKAFFTSQSHLRVGAVLLLIGVSIFLIAFKNMMRWQREKPRVAETPVAEEEFLARSQARQLIMWGGVGLLAVGMVAALLTESVLLTPVEGVTATASDEGSVASPVSAVEPEVVAEAAPPAPPDWAAMQENWPSFRGPGALGVAHFTNAPVAWNAETGVGIRWKTALGLPGENSPVVWGDRVFLSGADENTRAIYCYSTDTGERLWEKALAPFPGTPDEAPDILEDTGFAAPTMVAHGTQIFAIFANGDLVSYNREGEQVWGFNVGQPDNHYGHASSLLAWENKLYVQLDDSAEARLLAYDVASGKALWTAPRTAISWASPILAPTEFGPQLILNSESMVDAYAPDTGALIWSRECLGGEVAPSPGYSNGMVFVANEFSVASGIRLSETEGQVAGEVVWEYDKQLPEVSSPVGDGARFYFGTSLGALVCLDARTGEELWLEEFEDGFYSSPILVGDRLYVLDVAGNMHIVEAGADYKPVATLPMGETTYATPAFLDGRIYLRTASQLYCIEQTDA